MGDVGQSPVSRRAATLASVPSQHRINEFLRDSEYSRRQHEPGICDFVLGNPHEMPQPAYVEALREALTPRDEGWFGYKSNEPEARTAAARSLRDLLGIPFEAADVHLTTGGFTAIPLALKAVADPGDEVIFTLPPWFFYEPLVIEAGLVPVKVRCNPETFDLDLTAIAEALTPGRALWWSTHPTIRPAGSTRRHCCRTSPSCSSRLRGVTRGGSTCSRTRAYNRIVYDGAAFHSPAEHYAHTLLAYSYGKTHLAPGQRIGYLALPPAMPERGALREALTTLQMAMGWIYPNAVLQYALPRLEQFSIDIGQLQRKRDLLVGALADMGYRVHRPEGAFYLFVHAPAGDDEAFTAGLARRGVFVLPGTLFETPGFFRISLTASDDMVRRSLPVFGAAIAGAGGAASGAYRWGNLHPQ